MSTHPQTPARIGGLIRLAREQAGLDRAAAAHRAGITPAHLAALERADKAPGRPTIARLGKALPLTPEALAALYADEHARRTAHPWYGKGRMLGYRVRPSSTGG